MGVTNPFQQINASLPPLVPAPQVQRDTSLDNAQLPLENDQQQFSAPDRPQVFAAPKQTPQDRQETMLGGRLEQDYQKDLHPWGTPENHPGVMGKIAHALSWATGGPNRRLMEEPGIEGKLNKLAELQSQNAYRGAEAGHLNAETPEIAPNAESTRELQGAQARNQESETSLRDNPSEEWKAIPQVIGPNGEPVEIEGRSGKIRFGDVSGLNPAKEPKPNTPEQQYIDEYRSMHKGSTIAAAEKAYTNDTQRPPQAIMLAPGPNGVYTAQNVKPGSQVAAGAISTGGLNTIDTPTSTQRTAAGRAETVLSMAPEVLSRIDGMKGDLGPVAGRWDEFMQGKIGAPNAEFAALRSDLLMMASAVALAHAQGRLPENLRQEFDHAINAPHQSAENLKSTIQTMLPWLQKMQEQGNPNTHTAQAPQGEPAVGTVENGYRYKGGGAGNQANWEPVRK